MVLPERLESALSRLSASLDHLEAAAERQAKAQAGMADLRDEFFILQDDRSRLANELDGALARAQALLAANAEVTARLDRAGVTIQAVLAAADPDGSGPDVSGANGAGPAGAPAEAAGSEPPY